MSPQFKKTKNKAGDVCWFDPESHRYRVESTGEELTPVTTFVKSFFAPFDLETIAARVAKRRGVTDDFVKAEWAAKRDEAGELGTRTHENIEDWVCDKAHRHSAPRHDHERDVFRNAWEGVQAVRSGYRVLAAEKMVFCAALKLAGTIDLLAQHLSSPAILIGDWKTNAVIREEGFGKGLEPLTHLEDCNLVHYGLQLATYEMILRHGEYIKPDQQVVRALVHIDQEGPRWIPLPDLSIEVGQMIAWTRLQGYHDVPF